MTTTTSLQQALALCGELTAVVHRHMQMRDCSPREVIAAWLGGYVSACLASDLTEGEMHELLSDQLDLLRVTIAIQPEPDA